MNTSFKRNGSAWLVLCAMGAFTLALSAQGASFDCAKAQSKVEHMICDSPEISKLDDELNTAYKTVVQDKQRAEAIKQAQKLWMKERNNCADANCVKRAYETRLANLASDGNAKKQGSVQSASNTDDYVLDPAPKEMIDWNWEDYKKPEDKDVCALYLQNLQYFARRNEPLSCGQPIAPMLQDKIKKAEWENLDPDQYPDLFKAAIKEAFHFGREEPSEKEIKLWKKDVKERAVVFRRLKFDLKGSPGVEEGSNQPLPEQELKVIQIGYDVTSPDNPQTTWRCHPLKGRVMPSFTKQHQLDLFIVAKDLSHIFGKLWDWRADSGQNLWLINERIYGEQYDENADVKLTELRKTDFGNHLILEPVCLYHFNKTSHKE